MPIGDFGLVKGNDKVGMGIRLAEILNGDGSWNKVIYSHAFIVITDELDPQIVEAEPGGARIGRLSEYELDGYVISSWNLSNAQRANVAQHARLTLDTPYSFLDYGSLALLHFGIRPEWVRKYVADSGHMICSQLVDYVYMSSGLPMFKDNRFVGDVTPQDLAAVLNGPM